MDGSVHTARGPTPTSSHASAGDADPAALELAGQVLSELRGAKSAAKASMRAEISLAVITDTEARLAVLAPVLADVVEAGNVTEVRTEVGETFSVDGDRRAARHPALSQLAAAREDRGQGRVGGVTSSMRPCLRSTISTSTR